MTETGKTSSLFGKGSWRYQIRQVLHVLPPVQRMLPHQRKANYDEAIVRKRMPFSPLSRCGLKISATLSDHICFFLSPSSLSHIWYVFFPFFPLAHLSHRDFHERARQAGAGTRFGRSQSHISSCFDGVLLRLGLASRALRTD